MLILYLFRRAEPTGKSSPKCVMWFHRLSAFDRTMTLAALVLIGLTGLLLLRGERVGVAAEDITPPVDATGVSVRTPIEVAFDQAIVQENDQSSRADEAVAFTLSPPVSGTLRLTGSRLTFEPQTALQPNTIYTATIGAGLQGRRGQQLLEPIVWRFQTAHSHIIYAALDEQHREQLFQLAVDEDTFAALADAATITDTVATPQQVTDSPLGVWDFAVAPDGSQVVYTVLNENSASDLWLWRRDRADPEYLLACLEAACSSPAWSPGGDLLAFTRRSAATLTTTGGLSPPRVWLLDVDTGETAQLFPDGQTLGFSPLWSASGEWLSYLAPDLNGVGLYSVEDGREHFIETGAGEAGAWHPQENVLLVSILQPHDDQYRMHLYRAEADAEVLEPTTMRNLSGADAAVDDSSPAWSPDGAWIAFRRQELTGERATLGKHLWVMQADGSAARPLTGAAEYDHGQPVWSPDGRYLLYHRFPLKGPDIVLSIWLLDVETGAARELVRPGQRPRWLP